MDDNKIFEFDKSTTVQPQIENMRENIETILGCTMKIIGELTATDRVSLARKFQNMQRISKALMLKYVIFKLLNNASYFTKAFL